MGRFRKRCLLCKNEELKTKREVLFHVFTKSATTFHAWIEVCNLDAKVDYVANVYICSDHFLESDYKTTTRGKVLINCSIPSVNVPNKTFAKQIQSRQNARLSKPLSTSSQRSIKDSIKHVNIKTAIKTEVKAEVIEFEEHEIKTEPKNEATVEPYENANWTAVVKMEQEDPIIIAAEIEVFSSESPNKHFSSKGSTLPARTSGRSTKLSRKGISNPRYVGDIRLNHFDNRQRIKTMEMVRNTVSKMRRKIKLLKQQNGRLNAKLKILKNIIKKESDGVRKINVNGNFLRKQ